MPVAKDQDSALLVQIVVMLSRDAIPFAGTGARKRVPLGIGIFATGTFGLIPNGVHQTESLLDDNRPGGIVQLAQAFIYDQLAKKNRRRTDRGWCIPWLLRRQGGRANIDRCGVGRIFGANIWPITL